MDRDRAGGIVAGLPGLGGLIAALLALVLGLAGGQRSATLGSAVATPIGVGPRYDLPARPASVSAGRLVDGLACARATAPMAAVHVELFVNGEALLLPGGIGIAPPVRTAGGVVSGGRCRYPAFTTDRTGVIELTRRGLHLGELFAIWGQPLSPTRLAGGRGRVSVYVNGRRVAGDPAAVPLREHAEIVLEVGGFIPPHRTYVFPPGSGG